MRQSENGLYDSNIQSDFYPDSSGNIWFCTFTGYYSYNLQHDRISPYRVTDHNGDTIFSEYRVIGLERNQLFLYVGEEVIRVDLTSNETTGRWCLGSCSQCAFEIVGLSNNIMLYAGGGFGLEKMMLRNDGSIEERHVLTDESIYDLTEASGYIWAAGRDRSLYKIHEEKILEHNSIHAIPVGLSVHKDNLILNYRDGFSFYDLIKEEEGEFKTVTHACTQLVNILDIEIDEDSILWISSDGDGVFTTDLTNPFYDLVRDAPGVDPPVTAMILPRSPDEFVLFTRNRGSIVINTDGTIIHEYGFNQNNEPLNIRRVVILNERAVFVDGRSGTVNLLDPETGRTTILLSNPPVDTAHSFIQLKTLRSGLTVGSTSVHGMGVLEMNPVQRSYTFRTFSRQTDGSKSYTYMHELNDGSLLCSYNEEVLHLYVPDSVSVFRYAYEIPLSGGIWGMHQYPGDSIVYVGNSEGLFRVHAQGRSFSPISDDVHLPMMIYAIVGDTLDNLWMSTNSGILRYDLKKHSSTLYGRSDGVSSQEFNGLCFYQDEDHNIYFGGTEGVTVFNPYKVKASTKQAPLDIYGFKINDTDSDKYKPGLNNPLVLKYHENTVTFEFQAIDYANPEATRVKYQMSNYDRDWVIQDKSLVTARYPNMTPGMYTLSLAGANADGVYSDTIKTVSIEIIPPYYMTWWFRILAGTAILTLGYFIVRWYYRRQLERKDLLLKQQSLLIEKQQAVERERNRIAAEMHDDLGAGLTRIRFLSERALKQAEDSKESEQIQRIAEQSNQLVTNMSEIIWAMNSRFDTAESLAGYIRHYASAYLEEHGIGFSYAFDHTDTNPIVTAEKRRNVFLVVKEVLHNTVKHSGAGAVDMRIKCPGQEISVAIVEQGGKGFDPLAMQEKGNGLYNMQKRMQSVGGQITFERGEDMHIAITIPLETETP